VLGFATEREEWRVLEVDTGPLLAGDVCSLAGVLSAA